MYGWVYASICLCVCLGVMYSYIINTMNGSIRHNNNDIKLLYTFTYSLLHFDCSSAAHDSNCNALHLKSSTLNNQNNGPHCISKLALNLYCIIFNKLSTIFTHGRQYFNVRPLLEDRWRDGDGGCL